MTHEYQGTLPPRFGTVNGAPRPYQYQAPRNAQNAGFTAFDPRGGMHSMGPNGQDAQSSMSYMPAGQYMFGAPYSPPMGQLPPRFGQNNDPLVHQFMQPQQPLQNNFPFQIPGLGDFYQPHGMGDAQNVSNSGPMANFIGNQWGQVPNQQSQPQPQYLFGGGYRPPTQRM